MNFKGLELINEARERNQNEIFQELIYGLRHCSKIDLSIILNEDFKRLENILLSVIQDYYENNKNCKTISTQGRTFIFIKRYLKDIKRYKEKYKLNIDPFMLVNLFYYENIEEIYCPYQGEDWLITIIRTAKTKEEKIVITELLLSHVQDIISQTFGVSLKECIPVKIIKNLENF